MSMHKETLTKLEESGLKAHGLSTDSPSQLSDCFRLGVKWSNENNDSNRIALLQYESLRKNFSKMIEEILGEDYYNMGMDVYTCDQIACEDIINKANKLKIF